MLSIFFIAIALSLDAFSLALSLGTIDFKNIIKIKFSLYVGIMHFLMFILGIYISSKFLLFLNQNNDIFLIILFIAIGILMISEKTQSNRHIKLDDISLLILSLGVSLDSFSMGLALKSCTHSYLLAALIFSLTSLFFTIVGLYLGNFTFKILKEKATTIGAIILFVLATVNIIRFIALKN